MSAIPNPFAKTPVFDRYPPTGIRILVAGAGIAGLSFAIEAYRKGHDVCVIDRRPHFNDYGMMVLNDCIAPDAHVIYRRLYRHSIFCAKDTREMARLFGGVPTTANTSNRRDVHP